MVNSQSQLPVQSKKFVNDEPLLESRGSNQKQNFNDQGKM